MRSDARKKLAEKNADHQIHPEPAVRALIERERRKAAAEAWDEAINHVWELSDPISTVDHAEDPPVNTVYDMRQAMRANPYRAATNGGDQ